MDTLYSHESVSYPRKRQGGGRLALSRKVCSWFHFHFHSSRETDELRAVGNAKYGSSSPARHPRHSCRSGRGCERLLRAEEVRSPTPLVMERLANIRGGHVSWPSPPRSLLTRSTTCTLERTTDLVSMLGLLSKSVKICAGYIWLYLHLCRSHDRGLRVCKQVPRISDLLVTAEFFFHDTGWSRERLPVFFSPMRG